MRGHEIVDRVGLDALKMRDVYYTECVIAGSRQDLGLEFKDSS
jgi:hypothetical protein